MKWPGWRGSSARGFIIPAGIRTGNAASTIAAGRNFQEQRSKSEEYSMLSARAMFESGRRNWRAAKWFATPWAWIRYFVLGAGFLDGYRGFVIARSAAHTVWLKYTKLGELVELAAREKK